MMMKEGSDLKMPSRHWIRDQRRETLPASVYRAWREQNKESRSWMARVHRMLHIFISARPGRSRPEWTGEVVPGYEAMVIDEARIAPVPDGTPGLLAVRGPTAAGISPAVYRQQQYVRTGWNIPVTFTSAIPRGSIITSAERRT